MNRLARALDGDAPPALYLVVAGPRGPATRVDYYRVAPPRDGDGEGRLLACCPVRGGRVPAEELVPEGAAFDLLADPSYHELAEAVERLGRPAAPPAGGDAEAGATVAARLVELELRALIRRTEMLALALDRGAQATPAAREAWARDKARIKGLFRRWSELTGVPVLVDLHQPA